MMSLSAHARTAWVAAAFTMATNLENFSNAVKIKFRAFGTFTYNRKTGTILGRTCISWAQIGAFFFLFYTTLAVIFAVHLAIFIVITPSPGVGVVPWNYGRYAYLNYPNRKIDLIMTPKQIFFGRRSGLAGLANFDYGYIDRLRDGAVESGVGSHCLNRANKFGFSSGEPCIYVHIAKTLNWIPEYIDPSIEAKTELPFICTFRARSPNLTFPIMTRPSGLRLNIQNNNNSRSFPFLNQEKFKPPVMGLMLNLTALPPNLPDSFTAEVSCSLNYTKIRINRPDERVFNRIYEIPTEPSTRVTVQP